jgi:hypothetical protein
MPATRPDGLLEKKKGEKTLQVEVCVHQSPRAGLQLAVQLCVRAPPAALLAARCDARRILAPLALQLPAQLAVQPAR